MLLFCSTLFIIKSSLITLTELQLDMSLHMVASDAIAKDAGVGKLFEIVDGLYRDFQYANVQEKTPMPPQVTQSWETEVLPALADITVKLRELWAKLKCTVEGGNEGKLLVDEFLVKAREENSAVVRLVGSLNYG